MEPSNNSQSTQQTISLWITSLAVSITCCAVLFVVFAGYLTDIKKNLAEANTQLEQMSLHQDQLLIEIRSLQKSLVPVNATQAQPPVAAPKEAAKEKEVVPPAPVIEAPSIAPAPATTAPVTSPVPSASTPAASGPPPAPSATAPSPTAPLAPAAAQPTAIPEVPAKK